MIVIIGYYVINYEYCMTIIRIVCLMSDYREIVSEIVTDSFYVYIWLIVTYSDL